ncbi:MAG TPA: hypothetical protein DCM05_15020 [Elusimicrobia bacterium]|nr:hypothetical protein [Elusimicrobiota bacterium]
MTILLVGDDLSFCQHLRELLESQSHQVVVSDPPKAVQAAVERRASLAVLSGAAALALVKTLRSQPETRQLPILQINPRGSATEVVEALDAGADDYLVKPFNGMIFLARVRTLLRRQIWAGMLKEEPAAVLRSSGIVLRHVERTLSVAGQEILLTRLEFDLLSFFMRNKDKALKRTEILEAVWKYPEGVETRTLDKHVETLRRKLGSCGQSIRTVHGVGYRFTEEQAASPTSRT